MRKNSDMAMTLTAGERTNLRRILAQAEVSSGYCRTVLYDDYFDRTKAFFPPNFVCT